MSKKILIAIIVILLAITAVYVFIWKEKNNQTDSYLKKQEKIFSEKAAVETKVLQNKRNFDSIVIDSEIESDLNAISEDSFSEESLADSEMGL
jgi:uncharacterized protein YxeA